MRTYNGFTKGLIYSPHINQGIEIKINRNKSKKLTNNLLNGNTKGCKIGYKKREILVKKLYE